MTPSFKSDGKKKNKTMVQIDSNSKAHLQATKFQNGIFCPKKIRKIQ